MQQPTNADEIERELRATLSARQEMGSAYEDHLIEGFMQKLNQRALVQPTPVVVPQPPRGASAGQRLALAIVSVGGMIPLSAIALALGGFPAFLLAGVVVLGINLAFNAAR
jgi:hypothetical protein